MQKQNRSAIFGDFAVLSTLVILFAASVALVGCGGGGGSTAPNDPASPPPCYRADEPNDSFETPNVVVPTTSLYMIEGNIDAGDLDCILVTGLNGAPFNTTNEAKVVEFSINYAAGWDMDVYVGWQDPGGVGTYLWQRFDAHGQGGFSGVVEVPAGAGWLSLAIGQNTLNTPPDETRYTWTVETF